MTVLILGDCLQEMKAIPDGSVDLVLTDLPYGVTNAEWDTVLPLPELWAHWRRILRPFGTVLLFGAQPFISDVISSNRRDFSHVWYWKKDGATGHMNCHKQPMRNIEECAVFICNKLRKADTGQYPNARKYLREQKKLSGLTGGQINELLGGHMARHCFTNGSQFSFPSEDAYRRLQTTGLFQLPLKELKLLDKTWGGHLISITRMQHTTRRVFGCVRKPSSESIPQESCTATNRSGITTRRSTQAIQFIF